MTTFRRTLATVVLIVSCASALAQEPFLVRDINTTYAFSQDSDPWPPVLVGDILYVAADSPMVGRELLRIDSVTREVSLVKDLCPGSCDSSPNGMIDVNGRLLFAATTSHNGPFDLFATDGTADGTVRLTGDSTDLLNLLTVYGGRLFFTARDAENGAEVWVSDGTAGGTHLFKDLLPGVGGSTPTSAVPFSGKLLIGTLGGLWESDGTPAGTNALVESVQVSMLRVVDTQVFFRGSQPATGQELWRSDGTAGGTSMVKEIRPGAATPFETLLFEEMVGMGGILYFFARDDSDGKELWRSDGTSAGTYQVINIGPGSVAAVPWEQTSYLRRGNGRLFFVADNGVTGREPWSSDGTAQGTAILKDIQPGSGSSNTFGFAEGDGVVYFSSWNLTYGSELWFTAGTADSTQILKDIYPGQGGSAHFLTHTGGRTYIAARTQLNGMELWTTDGTAAGTELFVNIYPDAAPSSNPTDLVDVNGTLFFRAQESGPFEIWKSNGTPGTTSMVKKLGDQFNSPLISAMTPWRDKLYFLHQGRLWRSDGTDPGTYPVQPLLNVIDFKPASNALYLRAYVSSSHVLWKSDGTEEGTLSILPPHEWGISLIGPAFDEFYYSAPTSQIRRTSGIPAESSLVLKPAGLHQSGMAVAGGLIFLSLGGNDSLGTELWVTDGTPEGTRLVKDIAAGSSSSSPANFVVAGAVLYFTANDGQHGSELWRSDGTEGGTLMVADLRPGSESSTLSEITAVGDALYFVSDDPAFGAELWRTDGTPSGTQVVAHLVPGSGSSSPQFLTEAEGLLYFAADDGIHGRELWRTDGTTAGTQMVADLAAGGASSNPSHLTKSGDLLYFTVEAPGVGVELWAYPVGVTSRLTIDDPVVTEGPGVSVEFTLRLSRPSPFAASVAVTTADQTATAGSDYSAFSGAVTFQPGEVEKRVSVQLLNDGLAERPETFGIVAEEPVNMTLGDARGYALIRDDDRRANLKVTFRGRSPAYIKYATFTIENLGPSTAENVVLTSSISPPSDPQYWSPTCAATGCNLDDIPAGQSVTFQVSYGFTNNGTALVSASVTSTTPDPDPSDNTGSGWNGTTVGTSVNIYCSALAVGHTTLGSIDLGVPTGMLGSVVYLASSNPAVASVPASVTVSPGSSSAPFILEGKSLGSVVITADIGGSWPLVQIPLTVGSTPLCPDACINPTFAIQPRSTTISEGQSARLEVIAAGTGPFTYQWYRGNTGETSQPVSGATSSFFMVEPGEAGRYWVRISNGCGTRDSNSALVNFVPPTATGFYTLPPCRLLDTRSVFGAYGGPPIFASGARIFKASGRCGIPEDAKSISVNITVAPYSTGFLTAYPADASLPPVSTINFRAGKTRANNAIVSLSRDGNGSFAMFNGGALELEVIVDVNGYFK
jgi:ELWxxDGT repeat protein